MNKLIDDLNKEQEAKADTKKFAFREIARKVKADF